MPLREDILKPIPGENPSGQDLRYTPVYDKIKEARREDDNLNQGAWQHERKVADSKGVSVAQIAIAWVAAQGDDIVPLVGARRRERLTEALGAIDVKLDAHDLAAIEKAVPKGAAAGERYAAAQMAHLDSEKGGAH